MKVFLINQLCSLSIASDIKLLSKHILCALVFLVDSFPDPILTKTSIHLTILETGFHLAMQFF